MNDDELIRRALGTDAESSPLDPGLIDGALERGSRRRRRRVWCASGLSACLLAGAGFAAVAANGDSESVVGVAHSTIETVAPAPAPSTTDTVAPATERPSSTSTSSTSSIAPSSLPTVTTTTLPPGVNPVPPPPTVPIVRPECPAEVLTVDSVVFERHMATVVPGETFFVGRMGGSGLDTVTELWTASGRVATLTDTVADVGDPWWCPTRLRPLAFDGRWIWATSGGQCDYDQACSVPRTRVMRADLETGEVVEIWGADNAGPVLDALGDGAGGASIVTGPTVEQPSIDLVVVASDGAPRLEWSTPAQPQAIVAADIDGDSGVLAYTEGAPRGAQAGLFVVDLSDGKRRALDLTNQMIAPVPNGWSDDGRLLLNESWEGIGSSLIVEVPPGDAALSLVPGYFGASCWWDGVTLARATWALGTEPESWESGSIELVDRSGAVVSDFGIEALGSGMACLSTGEVVFTDYTRVRDSGNWQSAFVMITGQDSPPVEITSGYAYHRNATD